MGFSDGLAGRSDHEAHGAAERPPVRDLGELMTFQVRRILLVSSLYDAFILEEDGLLMDQMANEYEQVMLSSPPRVFRVSSGEEALEALVSSRFDLVITMARLGDMDPLEFGRRVKRMQPALPVVLLLTDPGDIPVYHRPGADRGIDKVFLWTGDSTLFIAITKTIEDLKNAELDIATGLVRVILVVEDSPKYYSLFLPLIYIEVIKQNLALLTEGLNEHDKMMRRRARPKIIHAETFEEAMGLYKKYRRQILCVITDVTYQRGGKEEDAGFELVRNLDRDIPVLLHSSENDHRLRADELGIEFLDKGSETLLSDLRDFFKERLGFGDFIFRMPDGSELGRASDTKEFIELIGKVPAESLIYHGNANQFSNWLMARAEVDLALRLRPKKVSDFKDGEELRGYLLASVREMKRSKQKGVVLDFESQDFQFEGAVTKLGSGSLGGKGRGIAFLASLLHRTNIEARFPACRIEIPDTLILATDLFDRFMEQNDLFKFVEKEHDDAKVAKKFQKARFPEAVIPSLKKYLGHIRSPIAVRSSSLLEDSQNQPFAGIYSTFMLPNDHPDEEVRLQQLLDAVKLVFASVYYKAARTYLRTSVHISEQERMAIVVQRLVGSRHGEHFYPLFSGVAQSINYYNVPPLQREEGISSVALGLGKMVMEGERALSFCPLHPDIIPGFFTPEEVMKNAQRDLYVLSMRPSGFDLTEGDKATLERLPISAVEGTGLLEYISSSYDPNDDRMRDGASSEGPNYITFSGILKHGMVPLPAVLNELLSIGRKGLGGHVEVEYAGTIGKDGVPEIYMLQIRPFVAMKERDLVVVEDPDLKRAIIVGDKALGNGVYEGVDDMVVVPPWLFDVNRTVETASEIGELNSSLSGRPYILVGPGRWGTRDRFLGIPVVWDQISGAKCLVEYSTEDFRVDPSCGTHFFHNITALGVPYFTVPYTGTSWIEWDKLKGLEAPRSLGHVLHIRARHGFQIRIDGRTGRGVILDDEKDQGPAS